MQKANALVLQGLHLDAYAAYEEILSRYGECDRTCKVELEEVRNNRDAFAFLFSRGLLLDASTSRINLLYSSDVWKGASKARDVLWKGRLVLLVGAPEDAIHHAMEVDRLCRDLGEERGRLDAWMLMGEVASAAGEFELAVRLAHKVSDRLDRCHPQAQGDLARSLAFSAWNEYKAGFRDEADDKLLSAVQRMLDRQGMPSVGSMVAMRQVADYYSATESPEKSKMWFEKLLGAEKTTLHPCHVQRLANLRDYSQLLVQLGKRGEAIAVLEEAANQVSSRQEETCRWMAESLMVFVGFILGPEMGLGASREAMQKALDFASKKTLPALKIFWVGERSQIRLSLAGYSLALKLRDEALNILRDGLEELTASGLDRSIFSASLHQDLAKTLGCGEECEEAFEHWEAAIGILSECCSEQLPRAQRAVEYKAAILRNKGDDEHAEQLEEMVRRDFTIEEENGPDHSSGHDPFEDVRKLLEEPWPPCGKTKEEQQP